jgi:large subunit ribosomal protein L23
MATTPAKTKKTTAVKETEKKNDAKTHPLIVGPRITEKSAVGAEHGVYTFNVMPSANKNEIKKAIKMLYGVTPVKIAITQRTAKVVSRRNGVFGTKQGGKKAVVYLKKGDKITFV